MRLTTKSRYALIAMADIALRGSHGPVALSTICDRHGMSLSYLEMLFSALRRAGLVVSTRGPGGGYALARHAIDITVADIAIASEQGKTERISSEYHVMSAHQGAMTQALWQSFNHAVVEHLTAVSLADVVAGQVAPEYVAAAKTMPAALPPPERPAPKRQLPRDGVPNSVFALGAVAQLH